MYGILPMIHWDVIGRVLVIAAMNSNQRTQSPNFLHRKKIERITPTVF
jgi:hypothetical protein